MVGDNNMTGVSWIWMSDIELTFFVGYNHWVSTTKIKLKNNLDLKASQEM